MDPISAISTAITTVIDKIIPNKDEANKAKLRYIELQQAGAFKKIEENIELAKLNASNVKAEIQGESKAQRNWRPYLMYTFNYLVLYDFGIYPFLKVLFPVIPYLPLPPQFWEVMMICVGGYIVGRTGEKIADKFKKSP